LSGAIPGAFEAWLAHRGLESLEVRFDLMCASAQTIAERLADHGKVAVRYPSLANHPQHDIAKFQMLRFGYLLGVTFASGQAADRFINECSFVTPATSFGGVHTTAERRARWGDSVGGRLLCAFPLGVEATSALWAEMAKTLNTL
jgi:cystathionine gamma-lyase